MELNGKMGDGDLAGGAGSEEELAAAGAEVLVATADLVRCCGSGNPDCCLLTTPKAVQAKGET